jgi:hypothetical protein
MSNTEEAFFFFFNHPVAGVGNGVMVVEVYEKDWVAGWYFSQSTTALSYFTF